MEEYERAFLEAVADNLGASIANSMREEVEVDLFEDEEQLTGYGRMWAQGYLTGRLSMLRSGATGNPNLSASDVERVSALVEENESGIAAQLYA